MTVLARFMREHKAEYVYCARQLVAVVIKKCINTKKGRYTEMVSKPISESAFRIYECVKRANSIYPKNQHEVQIRRDNLMLAKAELYVLDGKIGIAHEIYHFSDHDLDEMMGMIDKELNLIEKIMESDRKRYTNLPV